MVLDVSYNLYFNDKLVHLSIDYFYYTTAFTILLVLSCPQQTKPPELSAEAWSEAMNDCIVKVTGLELTHGNDGGGSSEDGEDEGPRCAGADVGQVTELLRNCCGIVTELLRNCYGIVRGCGWEQGHRCSQAVL